MAKKPKTKDDSDINVSLAPVTTDDIPLRVFRPNDIPAMRMRFGDHYIQVACHRTLEKSVVERFISDYGIERPASEHNVKGLGFRVHVSKGDAKVYRNSDDPIEIGDKRWVFSIRQSSSHPVLVCSVTIQVFEADRAYKMDFTTRAAIDSALLVYKAALDNAEQELRSELIRINELAGERYKNVETIVKEAKSSVIVPSPVAVEKSENRASRKLVVFKRR